MHIAFLTSEYPHPRFKRTGGIGTSIKNLAEALIGIDCKVSVFIYSQDFEDTFDENGISFYVIKNKNYKFGKGWFYRKYVQNYINTIAEKQQIDILEAPDWTGFTAFMNFKIPLILRLHGSDTYFCELEKRPVKFKNKFFEKLALKSANGIVSPSVFTAKKTTEIFNLDLSKIEIIANGINVNQFKKAKEEKIISNTILYFGTIIRKKGVLEIPYIFREVLKSIPTAKLILLGSDSYDIISGKASTWDLMKENFTNEELSQVSYLGRVPYQEIQQHIEQAHICIFPSLAETFGMVTAEAMSMGKAVVTSNMGWSNELIEHKKSGLLANPLNHVEFAESICTILQDKKLANTLGEQAIHKVHQNFNSTLIAKMNLNFYKKIKL